MRQLISFLRIPALVLLAWACGKDPVRTETAEATFFIRPPEATKARTFNRETSISGWCLFVSRDGVVLDYAVSGSDAPLTLSLPPDVYDICAVANAESRFEPASFRTTNEMESFLSRLSDTRPDALVMYGTLKGVSVGGKAPGPFTIAVTRLVARIGLGEIQVDFSRKPGLQDLPFTLDAMYLSNVSLTCPLSEDEESVPTSDTGRWGHRMGIREADAGLEAFTVAAPVSDALVSGTIYQAEQYFYAYPNHTASDSHSDTWCPRYTRLVIETTLGGEKRYYPITIPHLQRNHAYTIDRAIIKGRGMSSPEGEVAEDEIEWTFHVETDWGETYTITEES